jgi:hypothetical protein
MRLSLTLVVAFLAVAFVPVPALAATAGQAARVTARCFRATGWTATVRGRTVHARSPRLRPRNSVPRHPSFQVQFNRSPSGRLFTIQVSLALNDRETLTAKHCVNRGKRA